MDDQMTAVIFGQGTANDGHMATCHDSTPTGDDHVTTSDNSHMTVMTAVPCDAGLVTHL